TKDLTDLEAAFRGYETTFHFLDQIRQSFQSEQSKIMIVKVVAKELFKAVEVSYTLFEYTTDSLYLKHTFEFTEKSKAHLMLGNKQEKAAKAFAALPIELLEKEQKLQSKLSVLQKKIQSQKQEGSDVNKKQLQELENNYFNTYNEFETFRSQLESDYPNYYHEKYNIATVSIEILQQSLKGNQTVLSYFIGEEKIYLFAITSNEREVFCQDKPDNWETLLQDYLQSIKFHQKTKFHQLSFELYQLLLQEVIHHVVHPFAGSAAEQRQLFIIPHGELHYLPFETLIIQEAKISKRYQELDYLLNHCQISYHYSATLLHLDLQKQAIAELAPTEMSFTGFAPVYESSSDGQKKTLETLQNEYAITANRSKAIRSDGTWIPLPYSKVEVENISQLFEKQGYKSQLFLHNAANKSNLEEQIGKSRFVLIAAHGIVNDDYPELSGLILADDDSGKFVSEARKKLELVDADRGEVELQKATDDCILNMKEVAMIPMSADLVVLSSCESGIGELHKGEGMMAVNRGFLASGAQNVVSTLFKVNDQASSELTQLLFSHILKGESYSTALQKAKLELLKKEGMSPKAWSGFVLFGRGS
ncbi:MAG: CHAT domain-containing protein, partial [Chitinophagales bacterium]